MARCTTTYLPTTRTVSIWRTHVFAVISMISCRALFNQNNHLPSWQYPKNWINIFFFIDSFFKVSNFKKEKGKPIVSHLFLHTKSRNFIELLTLNFCFHLSIMLTKLSNQFMLWSMNKRNIEKKTWLYIYCMNANQSKYTYDLIHSYFCFTKLCFVNVQIIGV